MRKRLNGENVI